MKGIKIMEVMVTGSPSVSNPIIVELPKRVVSVAITCMLNSANNLIYGWDENPSQKSYLTPGDSRPYGPYREGDYINMKAIRCAFQNLGSSSLNPGINQALITVSFEEEEEYCP